MQEKDPQAQPEQNLVMQCLQMASSQPQEMGKQTRKAFQMHKRDVGYLLHKGSPQETASILSNERKYFLILRREKTNKIHIHNHRRQHVETTWVSPRGLKCNRSS